MRTVRRLRLRFLLLRPSFPNPNGFHIAKLSTSILVALSKPSHPHQKHNHVSYVSICYVHIDYAFGGGGENRTPVQNTFLVASYNHNLNYILYSLTKQIYFYILIVTYENHQSSYLVSQ